MTLIGSLVWHGERFIVSCVPSLSSVWDTKSVEAMMQHRHMHLNNVLAQLNRQAANTKAQVPKPIIART